MMFCAEEYELANDINENMFTKLNELGNVNIMFGTYNLDHVPVEKYPNINFSTFPMYFLYFAFYEGRIDIPKTREINTLFTCMNHQPHNHRFAMMYYLDKEKLLKNNHYSWHFNVKGPGRFWPYKPKINYVDGRFIGQQGQYPKEMYESAINLVTESTSDIAFITEKTFSSIIRKQPFIVYGCQGINSKLVDFGFKLYDNVIDYSFDTEPDADLRAEKIAKELKRLSNYNPADLYEQMKDTAKYNQTIAKQIILNQEGVPEMALKFKYYENIIQEKKWKLDSLE